MVRDNAAIVADLRQHEAARPDAISGCMPRVRGRLDERDYSNAYRAIDRMMPRPSRAAVHYVEQAFDAAIERRKIAYEAGIEPAMCAADDAFDAASENYRAILGGLGLDPVATARRLAA